MFENGKQRKGCKTKVKAEKTAAEKLKFGHAPGVEHFKVAAEVRTSHQILTRPGGI
jgi:hypothetical protein